MMIIILHGDNQVASRNWLSQFKDTFEKKGLQAIFIDGKSVNLEQINQAANTNSLLGEERLVVVDAFFVNKKITKDLVSHVVSGNIVFWEPRELSKTILNSFPKNWRVENFPIPQVTFKLLDALTPGSPQTVMRILHDMKEDDAYSLLPLIAWHTRYLIWAREEPKTLSWPTWRAQKLSFQASKFKLDSLYKFHEQLLNLDRSIKTGTNVLPPLTSLELLIANL